MRNESLEVVKSCRDVCMELTKLRRGRRAAEDQLEILVCGKRISGSGEGNEVLGERKSWKLSGFSTLEDDVAISNLRQPYPGTSETATFMNPVPD
ncbi:hypothetical protein LWI29_002554 [Acer saccharum]|uniref:Uncharacterized protein n=1 Tax=Acer saccharum TaxID=4024 RepID=A0AA39VN17_ACESA|nr:hypothetical protein LWI29_002554 [Acer saccharum]